MSVRPENPEDLVASSDNISPSFRRPRADTGFEFPPIALKNPVKVTNFESIIWYCEKRAHLNIYLRRPPSQREVIWWLEESGRVRTHGFPYLFREDIVTRMGENIRFPRSESDYSLVSDVVLWVASYYQTTKKL